MLAENYMLLNAPRTKESLVYGKVFVDFNATVRGPVNALVMRGNMNLLGNTDVTYVLMDSPLTVQDRLGDLVTFTSFSDTTTVQKEEAPVIVTWRTRHDYDCTNRSRSPVEGRSEC